MMKKWFYFEVLEYFWSVENENDNEIILNILFDVTLTTTRTNDIAVCEFYRAGISDQSLVQGFYSSLKQSKI